MNAEIKKITERIVTTTVALLNLKEKSFQEAEKQDYKMNIRKNQLVILKKNALIIRALISKM